MEVQIKGDQWNKRYRTVQVYSGGLGLFCRYLSAALSFSLMFMFQYWFKYAFQERKYTLKVDVK